MSLARFGLAVTDFGVERLRQGQLVVDPEHFSETPTNTSTTRHIICKSVSSLLAQHWHRKQSVWRELEPRYDI
jgi:hypothetical protein